MLIICVQLCQTSCLLRTVQLYRDSGQASVMYKFLDFFVIQEGRTRDNKRILSTTDLSDEYDKKLKTLQDEHESGEMEEAYWDWLERLKKQQAVLAGKYLVAQ